MSATNFAVKDPLCLHITITPIAPNGASSAIGAIGAQAIQSSVFGNIMLPSESVSLNGVFANDGDAARLESTSEEEDTYVENADGGVCISTKRELNKKLIIRVNTCSDIIDQLIELKDRRYGGFRVLPLRINLCDLCTGYRLSSGCAWMLSNPTKNFGVSDEAQEIVFLLTDIDDDPLSQTNSAAVFNASQLGDLTN